MNVYDLPERWGLYGLLEGTTRQANGRTWFVDGNSGNAGNVSTGGQGESWDLPFSTINYAVSQCTMDGGDVIFVAAGHTEAIADTSPLNTSGAVTDELCIDKSGVQIIGCGVGTNRPTITLAGATDAKVEIRAADVVLKNFIIVNNLEDVAIMLDISNANDGVLIENVEFRDSGAALECILNVSISAAADDVTIRGCQFFNTLTNTANTACIKTVGATTRLRIYDNYFRGDWSANVLDLDAIASFDTYIVNNIIHDQAADTGVAIDLHGSTTGVIDRNTIHVGLGATPIVAAAAMIGINWASAAEGVPAAALEMGAGYEGTTIHATYYLDSGTGSDSNDGKSWARPFATIGAAIDACTADNGDVIYVAAGHAQNLTGVGTTTEMDVDTNGISIIGLGNGNDRPAFTMITSTANANCYVTGDDCKLENLRFIANIASLEELIDVDAAGCQIIDCELDGNTEEPLAMIKIDGTKGDRLLVRGCQFDTATGDTDWGIYFGVDLVDIRIENNRFRGEYDVACVFLDTAANTSADVHITGNYLQNEAAGITVISIVGNAVTGLIANNIFVTTLFDNACIPSLCLMVDNQWVDLAGTGGAVTPNNDPDVTAEVFFVDSGATTAADAAGFGKSWDEPFLSIDYAIAFCTASQGAVIYVAPGHAESLTGAADITVDVIGISIIGCSDNFATMPALTVGTDNNEAAPVLISAAGCTLKNIKFIGGKAGGSQDALEISGDDTVIDGCIFYESVNTSELAVAANYGIITIIDSSASVERVVIKNCKFLTASGGNNESAISISDGSNGVTELIVENCYIIGTFLDGALQLDLGGDNATLGWIRNCTIINDLATGGAGACISIDAATVWVIDGCSLCSADVDAEPLSDDGGGYLINTHTCEKGAYSSDAVQGTVTNWGA